MEVEDLAISAFNRDSRMAFALVLDNDKLGLSRPGGGAAFALLLETDVYAFFDVLVTDDTALLRQDRRDVRVPRDQLLARLDLLAMVNGDGGAVRNLVLFELASLGIHDRDFAVALQRDHA